jgi:gamma-glutamylcysteine synthetase
MAAIAATSYATPSAQVWQGRYRLEQARRDADQAEANARQLRTEADQAEQVAQQSQTRVSSVGAQVAQAENTYSAQVRKQMASAASSQNETTLASASKPAFNPLTVTASLQAVAHEAWSKTSPLSSSGRFVNQSA